MRILIVEEALEGLSGHWFQYVQDLVATGESLGHEMTVAVHYRAVDQILFQLPALPILRRSVFNGSYSRGLNPVFRILVHNYSLWTDLRKLMWSQRDKPFDLLISTTPRLDHILAYWMLRLAPWVSSRGCYFILIFIELLGTYCADGSLGLFPQELLLKLVLQFTGALGASAKLRLVTESAELAVRYKKLCGINLPLVPHVVQLPDDLPVDPSTKCDVDPVFASFGITRFDKGTDLFQSAIHSLLDSNSSVSWTFHLQWLSDFSLPDGSIKCIDPYLVESSRVTYLPLFNSSTEYYAALADVDVMVLPYRQEFYRDKLSRVAIDAAMAGLPLVYPRNTWIEHFVQQYAVGVGFRADDVQSLIHALIQARSCYRDLRMRAFKQSGAVRVAFSGQSFFSALEEIAAC